MNSAAGDTFSNAKSYECYVGRWSSLVAQRFIPWLEISPNLNWLDLGTGTGLLTLAILELASPAKVVGVDLSADFVEFARQRLQDERVEFRVGDAASTAFDAPEFDVAVAGLVLNFLPEPQQGVKSLVQAVRNGGTVAAYVWDYSGQMEMMRHFWDAAIAVDPSASGMDAGQRFAICKPENLQAAFQTEGLKAVEVMPIDVPTSFSGFEDYWQPFLAAQGSVSKYLRGIKDETLSALRNQLQKQLPIAADGTIHLNARAWAAKGKK